MKVKDMIVKAVVVIGLTFIVGCATENPWGLMNREVVEDLSDDEIVVNGAAGSMAAVKKERKMQIAVAVDISDQSQGRAKPQEVQKLMTSAQAFARTYLENVKAYKLESVDLADINRTLKSGDDINGMTFPFLIKAKAILTSETTRTTDDWVVYSCDLQWELVDNRTKANGLGENPNPTVIETKVCQSTTKRRLKASVSGVVGGLGGSDFKNAQRAYNEVLRNCMMQFQAQLANLIPFGGVVSGLKILDDEMYFTLKADAKGQGVVKKMQMLLMNEDGDRIAVGEVLVSGNGKSNVKIWRWLSKSYRKQLESVVAKGKDDVENWLDENPLQALCLGLPEPPSFMQHQVKGP